MNNRELPKELDRLKVESEQTLETSRQLKREFIEAELATAMTFTDLSITEQRLHELAIARRLVTKARTACQEAEKQIVTLERAGEDTKALREKLRVVQASINKLHSRSKARRHPRKTPE